MIRPELLDPRLAVGSVVLDLGAGTGANAELLAGQGFRVVAVEPDEVLVDGFARRRGVDLCRADGVRLPLRDHSVDAAISIEVLEHVTDPEAVLNEIHRVLRPGGALTVAVPTGYTERFFSRIHPRYLSNARHRTVFDRRSLEALIVGAGFHVEGIRTMNLGPALAWLAHSILRSEADHTGQVAEHHVVDRICWWAEAEWARRDPRSHAWAAWHFGKSWYAFCRS